MHSILLLGGIMFDKILTVSSYPSPGSDTLITSERTIPSGCALNTAFTLKSFGADPHVLSSAGEEDIGVIRAYMDRAGLPTDALAVTQEGKTGYCLTVVDPEAERTFFTRKGIESLFVRSMIPQQVEFSSVYLTGYFLLDPLRIQDILGYLRSCEVPIYFDPGVLIGEIDPILLQKVLDLCYAITPNEKEYEILKDFNLEHIQLIVQKRGKGIITAAKGGETYTCYPYDVDTIDTTGAGDCFIGTLMVQTLEGVPLGEALKTASAAASYMTTVSGPHSLFENEDVMEIRNHARELRS